MTMSGANRSRKRARNRIRNDGRAATDPNVRIAAALCPGSSRRPGHAWRCGIGIGRSWTWCSDRCVRTSEHTSFGRTVWQCSHGNPATDLRRAAYAWVGSPDPAGFSRPQDHRHTLAEGSRAETCFRPLLVRSAASSPDGMGDRSARRASCRRNRNSARGGFNFADSVWP